jgi:hypothetical protein
MTKPLPSIPAAEVGHPHVDEMRFIQLNAAPERGPPLSTADPEICQVVQLGHGLNRIDRVHLHRKLLKPGELRQRNYTLGSPPRYGQLPQGMRRQAI